MKYHAFFCVPCNLEIKENLWQLKQEILVDCIRAFWNWYLLFSLKYYSRVGLNTKSTRLHFCASTNASAILESFQFSCRANMYFLKLHLFLYMTRLFLGFFSLWGSRLSVWILTKSGNRLKCVCSDKKKFGKNCNANFQIRKQNIVKSLNFLIKPSQGVIGN